MAKKTTIYDIAKKLNVTAATVSRALNDHPGISADTKKLVQEAAKAMNYEQNKLALALKSGRSKNIGVVVPYVNRNFFATVIRGIEEEVYPKGYHVIICQTHDDEKREKKIIQNLLNAQVEAILISVSNSFVSHEMFNQILEKNVSLIFFDRHLPIPGASSVIIDDYQGGYNATQHLIENGSKKIAYFYVDTKLDLFKRRYEGYCEALKDNGLPLIPDYVIRLKNNIEEGRNAAEYLMNLSDPPDAIFASTDFEALGAIKYLTSIGINIPKDFKIIGFSNEPFTEFMEMSISSMDQYPLKMGQSAAKIFLDQVELNKDIEKNVIIKPKLILRQSSAKNSMTFI